MLGLLETMVQRLSERTIPFSSIFISYFNVQQLHRATDPFTQCPVSILRGWSPDWTSKLWQHDLSCYFHTLLSICQRWLINYQPKRQIPKLSSEKALVGINHFGLHFGVLTSVCISQAHQDCQFNHLLGMSASTGYIQEVN